MESKELVLETLISKWWPGRGARKEDVERLMVPRETGIPHTLLCGCTVWWQETAQTLLLKKTKEGKREGGRKRRG